MPGSDAAKGDLMESWEADELEEVGLEELEEEAGEGIYAGKSQDGDGQRRRRLRPGKSEWEPFEHPGWQPDTGREWSPFLLDDGRLEGLEGR